VGWIADKVVGVRVRIGQLDVKSTRQVFGVEVKVGVKVGQLDGEPTC